MFLLVFMPDKVIIIFAVLVALRVTATISCILEPNMVASAGGTDRNLAAPQCRRNWGAYNIVAFLKIKLKLYHIL
jgi:hypothetical protein